MGERLVTSPTKTPKRKHYTRCAGCGLDYGRAKTWQFCGPGCRAKLRGVDKVEPGTAELVRERLEIGMQLECESRAWVREPLLRRAAEITELLR